MADSIDESIAAQLSYWLANIIRPPSSNVVTHFSERYSRFSVAEVAQTFGRSVQTAESLGDFRY